MMACTRCWRKARPIFKQHILALYPSSTETLHLTQQHPVQSNASLPDYSLFSDPVAQPRNLSELTYYAQMFPNKLSKIGSYMLKLLRRSLNDRNARFVHLSLVAMIGLVDACHSDDILILYDESVCTALSLLLSHPHAEHRILAAQGLCKLMSYIDDAADFRKYEPFFVPPVAMCTDSPPVGASRKEEETSARVRLSGLQAMSAMVIHFYSQRLVEHYGEVIPAVLANVSGDVGTTEAVNADTGSPSASISAAALSASAYETLSLLAAKVTIPDLDSALSPLFLVLDTWQWLPVQRCLSVMVGLTNGVQSDSDLVLFELLKHALLADRRQPTQQLPNGALVLVLRPPAEVVAVKSRMLAVAASLISAMRVNVLHWEGMVDLLIEHTLAAAKLPSASAAYQSALLACFSSYARKLPTAQDLISLLFHLTQFAYSNHPLPLVKLTLLQAADAIATQARDLAVAADVVFTSLASVESLVRSLLTCAVLTPEVTVRELVYDILLQLLLPPVEEAEEDAVTGAGEGAGKLQRFMSMIGEGKRGGDKERSVRLGEKEQRWILTILYHELSSSIMSTASPQSARIIITPASTTAQPSQTAAVSSSQPLTVTQASAAPVSSDSIVIVVDDERQSAASNVQAPGRGLTSPRAFELAYGLLLCLLYQSPASSLVLQWPFVQSLYQLTQSGLMPAANAARCLLLLEAWLCGVSRVFALDDGRETRLHTADIDEFVKAAAAEQEAVIPCPDLQFDPEQMSRGVVAVPAPAVSACSVPSSLDTAQIVRLLSRLLDAAASSSQDADESESAAEAAPLASNLLLLPFEPFNLKFLPPTRLVNEERETSWAPSHRPDNKDRRYSFDQRDSVTRVESPFHSPRNDGSRQGGSFGSQGGVVETAMQMQGEEAAAALDDQSYAAVASACNSSTVRQEAVFKQSMRILVDQTIQDDSVGAPPSASHPHTPSASQTSASSSKPAYSRRRSLSTRRQSGMQTGPLSSLSSSHHAASASASATADKFFAAPAVAAPPTLDVTAAIRQQIESSYALSPSHAVSGSVNVNGVALEDDGAAAAAKHNVRRSSRDMGGVLSSGGSGSGSVGSSKGADGHADWAKESWMLAEQRIDVGVGSVDENDEDDAALTDDIVYGLADDMEGIAHHHIAGTGENILKFHFPILNTFDSYLPAEFDM